MSPRAACRLEALGFGPVHDYVAGKADWLAAGRPSEGPGAARPRAGAAADRSVPTCTPHETVGDAARRARDGGWDVVVVVSGPGVVAGRLRGAALVEGSDQPVEEAMEPGPSTIRAHVALADIDRRLEERGAPDVLVTTPEGHLLGLLRPSSSRPRPE